jgi:hypothetical protein
VNLELPSYLGGLHGWFFSSGGNNARAFSEAIIQGALSVGAERPQPLSELPLWFSFDVYAVKATPTVLAWAVRRPWMTVVN